MGMHFSTVPVEAARQKTADCVRPLVLVVDDEPIITETLAAILAGSGLAALTASSAEEALEIVSLVPPEVLITDIAMPGMNGVDLAIEVKRSTPDCEIILFSGQTTTEVLGAMRSRGYDFLTLVKPVHPADMLHCVFEKLELKGAKTAPPVIRKSPDLYGYLSSRVPAGDVFSSPWNVTVRQRSRAFGGVESN